MLWTATRITHQSSKVNGYTSSTLQPNTQFKQYRQPHTRPGQQTIPASLQNPASRHSRCSKTGTRERACGNGTGQHSLAEHAQHAPQLRSIAWEGGGEAAMEGGAPPTSLLRESLVVVRVAIIRVAILVVLVQLREAHICASAGP